MAKSKKKKKRGGGEVWFYVSIKPSTAANYSVALDPDEEKKNFFFFFLVCRLFRLLRRLGYILGVKKKFFVWI